MKSMVFNKVILNNQIKKMSNNLTNCLFRDGKDCSICLTDKINTVILPCKHMCVCNVCCEDLRTKA
jgi:hypothetical protein